MRRLWAVGLSWGAGCWVRAVVKSWNQASSMVYRDLCVFN